MLGVIHTGPKAVPNRPAARALVGNPRRAFRTGLGQAAVSRLARKRSGDSPGRRTATNGVSIGGCRDTRRVEKTQPRPAMREL